mgnify:FL=1
MLIKDRKFESNFSPLWLCQLIASTSWVASVFVYGAFALGDYLQLLAGTAWTISNVIGYFKT